jgi:hypothetical protein
MVVTPHENDAPQSSCLESEKKVFPARRTLPVGHFYSEHLAPALPINADSHKDRARTDHCIHFLIPRVRDQVGIFAVQLPRGKAPEFLMQLLFKPTYRARAETVPTEFSR